MSSIEALVQAYRQFVSLPWESHLAGPQKVWFALYNPLDERRLRAQVGEFEIATKKAQHNWHLCDLTDCFSTWMTAQEYRQAYFESPEDLEMALEDFGNYAADQVKIVLGHSKQDANAVVAVLGIGTLFGLTRFSRIEEIIASSIAGRLLVFFPGERNGNNYRLLDARDGWNYLAIPISGVES